jgi:hypothetical protein
LAALKVSLVSSLLHTTAGFSLDHFLSKARRFRSEKVQQRRKKFEYRIPLAA